MKHFILTALGISACLGAYGSDFPIFQDGKVNPILTVSPSWWNATSDFNATNPVDDSETVFKFFANGTQGPVTDASMGIYTSDATVVGPLHSATLNFDWYAVGSGTYSVKLTSLSEIQKEFAVVSDGNKEKWNKASINIAETYPAIADEWKRNAKNSECNVFSVVLTNGNEGDVIYLKNIYYSNADDSWTSPEPDVNPAPDFVPVPTRDEANVVSLFSSKYQPATSFNIGNWGQATALEIKEIGGQNVYYLRNFNYLGWELSPHIDVSDFDYMHVDFWTATPNAQFGFTPISESPKAENVIRQNIVLNEWNELDVALADWPSINFADIFQIKFTNNEVAVPGYECYIANVYFWKDPDNNNPGGDEPVEPKPSTGNSGSLTGVYPNAIFPGESTRGDIPFTFEWTATWNDDGKVTVNAVITPDNIVGFVPQLFAENAYIGNFDKVAGNEYTFTTNRTYNEGDEPKFAFFCAYDGGATQQYPFDYIVGSTSEAPTNIILKATNVTPGSDRAEIDYIYTLPEGFEGASVSVAYTDGNGIEGTAYESPFTIEGLAESTDYTFTLTATATLDGDELVSDPVTVTFRTTRDISATTHTYSIVNDFLKNVYLEGETTDRRRDIPISIKSDVVYNPDQTVTINFTITTPGNIVGLVAQVNIEDEWSDETLTRDDSGVYSYTSKKTFDDGRNILIFFYPQFDNGAQRIELDRIVLGEENEPIEYGAPVAPAIYAPVTDVAAGVSTAFYAYLIDDNGNFILSQKPTLSLEDNEAAASLDGDFITLDSKGTVKLVAEYNGREAEATFTCHASKDSDNVAFGKSVTSSSGQNPEHAIDNNEGTEVIFDCTETQSHELTIDLGKNHSIESIIVVWEGASASKYTLTLTPSQTMEIALLDANDNNSYVITEENGDGGVGMVVRNTYSLETPVTAQFIKLNTQEAALPQYGIKLKQIYVYGSEEGFSGIADIVYGENEDVRFFNLQGVEVNATDMVPGIYIRRQGNTASKVYVK